jgi:hypothetical protein
MMTKGLQTSSRFNHNPKMPNIYKKNSWQQITQNNLYKIFLLNEEITYITFLATINL